MRIASILILLISIQSGLIAQTEYFNILDPRQSTLSANCANVTVGDSSYIISGFTNHETDGSLLELNEISFEGQFQNLGSVSGFYYTNYAESLVKIETGYLQASEFGLGASGIKFNLQGQLEWELLLYDSLSYNTGFHVCQELEDGNILFAGHKTYNADDDLWPNYSHLFLVKTDTDGNIIWTTEQEIEENKFLRFNGIFELEDGSMLLSGATLHDWDNLLVKVNFEGIIEDQATDIYIWGNEEISEGLPWLIEEGNGLFTIGYMEATEYVEEFDDLYSMLGIFSFDSNSMQVVGNTVVTEEFNSIFLNDFIKTPDGGYAMLIQDWNSLPFTSFIRKFDSEFNFEWMKYYMHSIETDFSNFLYDMEVTPGGGFICVGSAAGNNNQEAPQKTWILKLDACGDMEWQGCELVDHVDELNRFLVRIYPNPASDRITVSLNSTIPLNDVKAVFRNSLGQQVFATQIRASEQELDVSLLPSGVYMLSLVSDGRELYSERVIIE